MKILIKLPVLILLLCPAMAEQSLPEDFAAAGIAFNQYSSPQLSGTLLYARKIAETGTYSFSMVDVISKSAHPFTVATSISSGLAQHVRDIGNARVFAVTTVGVTAGGENVGYSYTAGGCVTIGLRKGWSLMPNARVLKSSLSDFQGIFGIAIGWGK